MNSKSKDPLFIPMLVAPIVLIITFTYVNFQPYSLGHYSLLDNLISLCYLLLWALLLYFTWKSKSVTVAIVYLCLWVICLFIIITAFISDPSLKDSSVKGFFDSGYQQLMRYLYTENVELSSLRIPTTLAILPLAGFHYIVDQFCLANTTIPALYITMIFISLSYGVASLILVIRNIRVHNEDKILKSEIKTEEAEHNQKHRFD